jgi:signal transduction histidine kinase
MQSESRLWLRLVGEVAALWVTASLTVVAPIQTAGLPVEHLNLPTNPLVLPYRCAPIQELEGAQNSIGSQHFADLDGDGVDEFYYEYSEFVDSAFYKASLVVEPHSSTEGRPAQHNGPLQSCRILHQMAIDVLDGPEKEVILTRQYRDTIFLEIVGFRLENGQLAEDTSIAVPAAIARGFPSRGYWHDIHVYPQLALDVNGDGIKDLIYSRSAKPDSAIGRGIVAYDVIHGKELWVCPVADLIGEGQLRVFASGRGQSALVAVVTSTANSYSVNGMSSTEAYAIGLTLQGRELWHRKIGSSMFYPKLTAVSLGARDDFVPVVTCDPSLQTNCDTIVRALDPLSGETVAALTLGSHCGAISAINLFSLAQNTYMQWLDDSITVISKIGPGLKLERSWIDVRSGSNFWIMKALDPFLLCSALGGRQYLMGENLTPVAMYHYYPADVELGHTLNGLELLSSKGYRSYILAEIEPQSLWIRWFARFQYPLLALGALLMLLVVWAGVTRFRMWRQAALGVPTLGSVRSLVLLLDRSGKIVFANKHQLADRLLGPHRRRSHYMNTGLRDYSELADAITRSFEEPLGVYQQRVILELSAPGPETAEVNIYPYVDKYNAYRGKIVLVEDLGGSSARQWKVVLGEAAQNWVHRLKHHFGTIRLIIGNIVSDPVIAERLRQSSDLLEQRRALDSEVLAGSEAAGKILKYLKNPQPHLTECDLSSLIHLILETRRTRWPANISVSYSHGPDVPCVLADPDQIREVMDNVLSNAVKAMPDGGQMTVSLILAEGSRSREGSQCVEVRVEDTGIGIAKQDLPHIFEPNFSKSPGGTGIGLAMVQEIIANHKGELAVESDLGKGTRFSIRLAKSEVKR